MNNFIPAVGYVEVEPIKSSGALVSDENNKWEEKAKVIKCHTHKEIDHIYMGELKTNTVYENELKEEDIIFFRRHGFFELAEHDGTVHYVVRVDPEFILGIIKHERKD